MNTYTVSQTTANYLDCRRALNALETSIRHALAYDLKADPDGDRVAEAYGNTFGIHLANLERIIGDTIANTIDDNMAKSSEQTAGEIAI